MMASGRTETRDRFKLCAVVQCNQEDSTDGLKAICESLLQCSGKEKYLETLVIWCDDCTETLVKFAHQLKVRFPSSVHVIESSRSFLSSLPSSLTLAIQSQCTNILLCTCGVLATRDFAPLLHRKVMDFGINIPLTGIGIRIFPHVKLSHPSMNLKEGREWRVYDLGREDRAVHFLTTGLCCISVEVLFQASRHGSEFSTLGDLWLSFIIGYHLNLSVWKIKLDDVVEFKGQAPTFPPHAANQELFDKLYSHMYDHAWPVGVSKPLHSEDKLKMATQLCIESPQALWDRGFGGVNMMSEPASELDFAAAASYGVRVIRVGAVGDAKDLDYLLDQNSRNVEEDEQHLKKVLPRLKSALSEAGRCGLKVIITLTDLPGSLFHNRSSNGETSFPFWESSASRTRGARFWGIIAESLADMKGTIMGYDLINEPYTLEDNEISFFDDPSMSFRDTLHQFHLETLREIRKFDKDTVVVVKGTWFASPKAIDSLLPLPDSKVAYAFHAYLPPQLALCRTSGIPGYPYSYPGLVSLYRRYTGDKVDITRSFLYETLDLVRQWQLKHNVPSNRILVAEFGICREVPGASQYLGDLVDIFHGFHWSWLLFSFRDEEWDSLDYELGGSLENMLHRSASELFMTVADHFQ